MTISGGDKFEARLKAIVDTIGSSKHVSAGFLSGATYPDGTSVPMVAAVQEYGSPSKNIPPRPFMRATVADHQAEWPDFLASALKANDYDAEKALEALGTQMVEQIQQSIIDTSSPPLSPITVMLRGMRAQTRFKNMSFGALISEAARRVAAGQTNYGANDKPLVASGHLLGSVDFEVKDGTEED